MNLEMAGWNDFWARRFEQQRCDQKVLPARVLARHRQSYSVWTSSGEAAAEIAGALLYRATPAELPAVGDWVALRQHSPEDPAIITAVLPRKTRFSRKVNGEATEEQVIAANVDLLFVVCGLDQDYNLRRLERYLVAARQSGAAAAIVLNKADLCVDVDEKVRQVRDIAPATTVVAISAVPGDGAQQLAGHIAPGATAALVGSSGAGKSTILNALLGARVQETQPARSCDGRGRHTTTHRELFFLPRGGLMLDNPGIRELQLWTADPDQTESSRDAVEEAFPEIQELAAQCAFRDCSHGVEPDCAVRAALETGEIGEQRWRSYLKLRRELRHAAIQVDRNLRRSEKERWKKACKEVKRSQKRR